MKKANPEGQKLTQKTWFIILWLIVFFPVGLFFMWRSGWNKFVKIIVSVIFGIALIGSILSPSKSPDTVAATTAPEVTTAAASEEAKDNTNPIMKHNINVADVKNGTGTEVIGKWASIEISKQELQESGKENFVSFVKSKVDGSGYNWFTLIFGDGTGLQFNESVISVGTYGEIDEDGCVTKSIGTILLKSDNSYEYSEAESSAEATEAVNNESAAENPSNAENIPTEYKSALNSATAYSNMMHMSKAGIYNQLTSEYGDKFSAEAAQYAVDNINADWNANALAQAKAYSDTMHMSKKGIYGQLISEYGEQFTKEEAQYAVDNVDANWEANALETAKNYQNTMNMSPEAIRDQLTSKYGEQFTKEEADYAIANLN